VTPHPSPAGAAERGFVIVGVVMMVLALTILGLSLFSLSSYEAAFLRGSLDRQHAFDAAQSGIERAKFQIGASGRLEAAAAGLPLDHVIGAVAAQKQGPDTVTSGPVAWGGDDVRITVTASVNGTVRVVEGRFRPNGEQSYYRRLVTTRESIVVDPGTVAVPRCGTVRLEGGVWTNGTDFSWQACIVPPAYQPIATTPEVPIPDVAGFIATAGAGTTHPVVRVPVPAPPATPTSVRYELHGPANEVRYYTLPGGHNPVGSAFTVDEPLGSPVISVQGIAVWLLPRGAWFFSPVTVVGGPNDALVIVAGRSGDAVRGNPDAGLTFLNSMHSPVVPVYLVSDGHVAMENVNLGATTDATLAYASIFARRLMISGRDAASGTRLNLHHAANAPQDGPGGVLERLMQERALPNAAASGGRFALVPGTWRESGD